MSHSEVGAKATIESWSSEAVHSLFEKVLYVAYNFVSAMRPHAMLKVTRGMSVKSRTRVQF